jgi:synaptic vesicle membrane protein VAT-1
MRGAAYAATRRRAIDATFPFEKAADAHRRLMERRNIGKVVLVPSAG